MPVMSGFILFDELFRIPFITGLFLAASLSLAGGFLRMRDEWLSALGLSQMAAAGGVAGLALGVPVMPAAVLAAVLASLVKALHPRRCNCHYALMLLLGWSAALVLAANTHHGETVAESLLRGQLYFVHSGHLAGAALLFAVMLAMTGWLSPRLLTERFFPDYYSANGLPARNHRIAFNGLVVFSAVLGTLSMGAFPAFALFFLPSWAGFVIVDGWYRSLAVSAVIGTFAYVAAFAAALVADQPFGPLLVLFLAGTAILRPLARLLRKNR